MLEGNKSDKFDVDAGARKLAIDTVLRALVDHASVTNPSMRDRILATVDAYIAKLEPHSELEHDFADRAKAHLAALIQPPAG